MADGGEPLLSLHREMLIDGHFIGGPCDQGVGKIVIRAPWDGSVVGTAAEGGWSEANTALRSAVDAFASWRFSAPSERQILLRRISASVRERADELASLLTDEVGKPFTWSRAEVGRLALTFDLAAEELVDWNRRAVDITYDPRGQDYEAWVERFPIGVVLGIVPYNWPYNLAAHKIAPALAVGNTIVVKASSLAPLSTLTLCRIIHEAGCPPGVVNVPGGRVGSESQAAQQARDPRVGR
jgi:acyl-CoA reductase-like NAD-dependent aldehyde dehydrogenase